MKKQEEEIFKENQNEGYKLYKASKLEDKNMQSYVLEQLIIIEFQIVSNLKNELHFVNDI